MSKGARGFGGVRRTAPGRRMVYHPSTKGQNKNEVQNESLWNSKNPDGFLPFPGF